MATKASSLQQIVINPGVQPSTDRTSFATTHWTFSDKVRFRNGFPQKIGGWFSVLYDYGVWPNGICRTVYGAVINNNSLTLLGTHTDLYSLIGSRLTNITPILVATTAIANALETDYSTLANNPITTVSGSSTVTVADTNASKYARGDSITIAGSSAVGGIGAASINKVQVIRSVGTNTFTINTGTNATSSVTGGGASVVVKTGLITITDASHGQSDGDRVKITLAATTGGVTAAQINLEFIIRNKTTNTFDVMTGGVATSHVTGGGGAATLYQKQIPAGNKDESFGYGYGCGLYGVGLYGTALISTSGKSFPRIWSVDRFADSVIMTPGNQGGLYSWSGSSITAPALIANAPAAINYSFVSDNIVVTFGAGNVNNHIFASDQRDPTMWVSSETNQVYENYLEGAGRLKSHLSVSGVNLIFTDNQTYLFSYIGLPNIWSISLLSGEIGMISPRAGCVVKGVAYWMGQKNWYKWAGANIEIIPANTQPYSTIHQYVFNNLFQAQKSKCFCWYNEQFDEIWWHYPSAGSIECDKIARFNVSDLTWCPDTMDRTAAEYPIMVLANPRAIDKYGILYNHEVGCNADGQAMAFTLTSNQKTNGKNNVLLSGFVPDSIQVGDLTVGISTVRYPQSDTKVFDSTYTVTPTSEQIPIQIGGRLWTYTITGEVIDQNWICGAWSDFLQESAPN